MENPSHFGGFPSAVKREPGEFEARPRICCEGCGGTDFDGGDDGFFYCRDCGGQTQDMLETEGLEEDMFAEGGALYNVRFVRHSQSQSQSRQMAVSQSLSQSQSQARTKASKEEMLRSLARNLGGLGNVKDEEKPHGFEDEFSQPMDFGNGPCHDEKALADKIRLRYIQGMQLMIQMQCKALVEKFGAGSIICGIVGEVWLRYLAARNVFEDSWADKAILEAEAAADDRRRAEDHASRGEGSSDARSFPRRKPIYIWASSLRRTIPPHSSISFIFLGCHIAREQILPTDLVKWATEGELPYFTAFSDIDKSLGNPGHGLPLSSRFLFRPAYTLGSWQMESTAGSIAQCVGLHLPPVNFHAIARRYLMQLSLPTEKILQQACRIYEWSTPAELWLSANPFRLPTRVAVIAILMVCIRVVYCIHGHGVWERSLSSPRTQKKENQDEKINAQAHQCDAEEILRKLETKYIDMKSTPNHARDFKTYLKYCREIVFAGTITSYDEDKLIAALWDIYEKEERDAPEKEEPGGSSDGSRKRSRDEAKGGNPDPTIAAPSDGDPVEKMKRDMKGHGFEYLPPRTRRRTDDYLHYRRKKIDGRLLFVAHADYFILLRAMARLAEIDARIVHLGVLRLERRLRWLERRTSRSLAAFRRRRPTGSGGVAG